MIIKNFEVQLMNMSYILIFILGLVIGYAIGRLFSAIDFWMAIQNGKVGIRGRIYKIEEVTDEKKM